MVSAISRWLARFQSALPHEERLGRMASVTRSRVFQSALPHEERFCLPALSKARNSFQSALPHEERYPATGGEGGTDRFNPRSRTRSDIIAITWRDRHALFQSALPHEER